jgi:hypothetical protein
MTTVSIDHQDYEYESLSEDAKAQLASLQFVDQELVRHQAKIAALQTARNAYAQALRSMLPVGSEKVQIS